MFTTLPLELFVCREVIEQFFFAHESYNQNRHVLFTTSILVASMFSTFTQTKFFVLRVLNFVSSTL